MQIHSFGNWLKRRRKALDLTQAELANQVGCSAAAIRKMEAEERRPSAQIIERMAEIFNVPRNERTAFHKFARGDWKSAPGSIIEDAPWQDSTQSPRSNLPIPTSSLIGREGDVALVREYLSKDDIRLVTLTGPPGIGKTRLGIKVAREVLDNFHNGVFFVALASLDDPALIALVTAQSLGYVAAKNISVIDQLKEGIGEKHILLVLDNCEHLIEDVASFASHLLSACSHLKILATSRESLRIPGEWQYSVPVLNTPKENLSMNLEGILKFPALALFAERARAVRSDFTLTPENIQTVVNICARLDGLPLAIELIAARMRWMSPEALLKRLHDQFTLSADGMRALSPRQKTLNNAIGWSYDLLSEEEQKLFARLSIFSGGFTLETAEEIFSVTIEEKSVSDLIGLLLDKSLLQHVQDQRGNTRYTMLVTIQEFARERLRDMGEETEVHTWYLAYFLDLSERADKELRGPNQAEWMRYLGAERDNLRSVLEWAIETGQTERALQMACHLSLFWFRRSDLSEGRQWLGQALRLPNASQYPRLYSYALAQLAFHTWLQIRPKEARPFVEQALSVARAYEDKWNTAWALTVNGLILISESNFTAAKSVLEDSKVLFQEINDEWGYANAVISLGNEAYNQDDLDAALALHEESLLGFRKLGDSYFESVALRFIGMLKVKQGDLKPGVDTLREALILAQQLDSKYEVAAGLQHIGDAAEAAGNLTRAVRLYWGSRNIFDSIGAWQEAVDTEFEDKLATCRVALDELEFTVAVEQGRAMTMEQAIAYALEDQD